MLMKYSRPTKYDKEPSGSLWHADMESGIEMWIQCGESEPDWKRIGDIYEKYFITFPDQQEVMGTTMMMLAFINDSWKK